MTAAPDAACSAAEADAVLADILDVLGVSDHAFHRQAGVLERVAGEGDDLAVVLLRYQVTTLHRPDQTERRLAAHADADVLLATLQVPVRLPDLREDGLVELRLALLHRAAAAAGPRPGGRLDTVEGGAVAGGDCGLRGVGGAATTAEVREVAVPLDIADRVAAGEGVPVVGERVHGQAEVGQGAVEQILVEETRGVGTIRQKV